MRWRKDFVVPTAPCYFYTRITAFIEDFGKAAQNACGSHRAATGLSSTGLLAGKPPAIKI